MIIIKSSHSDISIFIFYWMDSISSSDWIVSQSSTKLNPINCDIFAVKEFTKWMTKPWVQSADNTIELIIDQSWGAQPFTWHNPIIKCLNLSGVVSPPYLILESPYSVLTICDMR